MMITRRNFIKGAGLLGIAYVLLRTSTTERDSLPLEEKLNYLYNPGRHTVLSPVVGSRADEYNVVKEKLQLNPALGDFEDAIKNPYFSHLIPWSKKDDADKVAEELFVNYITRYGSQGVTSDNIVDWRKRRILRAKINTTCIYDTENEDNTWHVHAIVKNYVSELDGRCVSKYLIALHEVMHIEETTKKASKQDYSNKPAELIPTLKSIILSDEIYKRVHGIELSQEVDYKIMERCDNGFQAVNKVVKWRNNEIGLGNLANFYRSLEQKYGSIGKAVVSEESLNLVNGKENKSFIN